MKFSHIIAFKVASNSACYLTNCDYVNYILEKTRRENKAIGKKVKKFSVLFQIVEAAL